MHQHRHEHFSQQIPCGARSWSLISSCSVNYSPWWTYSPLPSQQAAVEKQSSWCKQVCFSFPDSTSVWGKQVISESQSGMRAECVCVCVCVTHDAVWVFACTYVCTIECYLTFRTDDSLQSHRVGGPVGSCCHGSKRWKQQIFFQYRLQMLGHGLSFFLCFYSVSLHLLLLWENVLTMLTF